MHPDLLNALTVIGAISSVGRLKIEAKLRDLSQQEQLQVVALIKSADNLAFFWQGSWVQAARAWLLARVAEWAMPGRVLPPGDAQTQMMGWVAQLRSMAETVVRQQLLVLVTGRATLDALALAQCDVARRAWRPNVAFTEPRKHNDNKFCYLVHAMRPTTGLGVPSKDTLKMHEYTVRQLGRLVDIGSDRSLTLKSAELYLTNPGVIEAEMLSCSLICENRKKLYGNFSFGFILSVPSTNICIASPRDLAISNSKARAAVLAMQPTPLHRLVQVADFLDSLLGLYQQPLPPPSEILALSSPTAHNEVVVLGFAGTARIKVSGIFIKVTGKNRLWQSFVNDDATHGLRDMILLCAAMCDVPIVPIQDDNVECPGSAIDFKEWLEGKKTSPTQKSTPSVQVAESVSMSGSSSLVVGDMVSVYRDQNLTREYDMIAIRESARLYLQQGMTPEQVHRRLHDQDGLPHAVAERTLELLGHRSYM